MLSSCRGASCLLELHRIVIMINVRKDVEGRSIVMTLNKLRFEAFWGLNQKAEWGGLGFLWLKPALIRTPDVPGY